MTISQLLLTIILLQQGFLGLIWLGAAAIGLARRPAWHWGLAAAAMAVCLAGVMLRDVLDPWLGLWLANSAGVAAMTVLRRGVQIFCDQAPTDRQHLGVCAAVTLWLALAVSLSLPNHWIVLITSLGLAWGLLGAAGEAWSRLRFEFGKAAALAFALPLAVIGSAFALRAMLAPLVPDVGRTIGQLSPFNVGFGLFIMAAMLTLHFALAAMVVLRLVRQLRHLSDHDALTGLLNRRGFEQRLQLEAERLRRYATPFAVLSIDIDHFKLINDRFGHGVGDEVLTRVARALQLGLRDVDRIGRMGGEEFCVLLPHSSEEGAAGAAQRLRERVRDVQLTAAVAALPITVSVGVACAQDAAEPLPELMRRLDRALYRAKDCGRDRVEMTEARNSALRWSAA